MPLVGVLVGGAHEGCPYETDPEFQRDDGVLKEGCRADRNGGAENNPSPDSRPLVRARGASHPLPSERELMSWAHERTKIFATFSPREKIWSFYISTRVSHRTGSKIIPLWATQRAFIVPNPAMWQSGWFPGSNPGTIRKREPSMGVISASSHVQNLVDGT
jgi:hypothetical protein